MNIRTSCLLILLSVDIFIAIVDVFYLDVDIFLFDLQPPHLNDSLLHIGLDYLCNTPNILGGLNFGILLLPLFAQLVKYILLNIDQVSCLDNVLIWRQKVCVVIAHGVSRFSIILETSKERVNLVHVSLEQGPLQEFEDRDGYLKKVTATIRKEVVPDSQNQTKRHGVQKK